ncbi:hypothetical protein VPNG_08593 [Cytospora leucostoma]|uniref:N-acetyltransferase domain-containing protein n=1 Tax=Cytospora leucostoma TaxID=1230097 RepID=A0A423W4A1_9PEZI|nr:hypothetical protein VPNG_08593 [Cytospora leucostoma]
MSTIDQPAHPKCILEPIDLLEQAQADELLRQRKICGWSDTPEYIAKWKSAIDRKAKSLFWIRRAPQPDLRIGHISLDSEAHPPDLELANPIDKSVLTINTLFILPEHRGGGIGRAAIEALEKVATVEPYGSRNCRTVALTTLSRRYGEDDEWRAIYEKLVGVEAPKRGKANEDWYTRMGYVKWKDEGLWDGPDGYKFIGAFLRKRVA